MASRARRSRGAVAPCALLLVACLVAIQRLSATFSLPHQAKSAPQDKRMKKGTLHNKDTLPRHVEEIPLPVEEEPIADKEELPPYKPPYTLHIEAHLPGHKPNFKYIQRKVTDALHSSEDFVQHVEVSLHEEVHFHKNQKKRVKKSSPIDGSEQKEVQASSSYGALAPFQMKAVVQLKNHHQVVLSNPEKHAQATLTEAVDHMADGLRKLVREEKEKQVKQARKNMREMREYAASSSSFSSGDEDELDALAARKEDALMSELEYQERTANLAQEQHVAPEPVAQEHHVAPEPVAKEAAKSAAQPKSAEKKEMQDWLSGVTDIFGR